MPDTSPRIAVIIVNYNAGSFLNKCLNALSYQTLKPARVIVVDNFSSDKSADSIEHDFTGTDVIRLSKNVGFAAANNLASKTVKDCQWLALLNPDAFPEPDWLANLIKATEKFPQFSFFSSRLISADNPTLLDGTGDTYHVSGRPWRRDHGISADKGAQKNDEVFSACAAAALYKTSDFTAAGGFDESFFCYMEDVDLGFRLRLMGKRCMYVHDSVVAHVGSATTSIGSDFYIYHGQRNLVWTFFKNMPWPLILLYLPQHLMLNLAAIVAYSLKGRGRIILKAKWDAFKSLPIILRKRHDIQRQKTIQHPSILSVMKKGLLRR